MQGGVFAAVALGFSMVYRITGVTDMPGAVPRTSGRIACA
jgi:branched-subunit amino acid ABC-type transport system permease component